MKKHRGLFLTLLTYILAFLYFFPVLWIFLTGFKTENEASVIPPSFIFEPTLAQYRLVWDFGVMGFILNSGIVTVFSTAISLLLGVPAAYALSMYRIRKSNDILFWFISTKFLPVAGVIIPIYLLFQSLNLIDTLWALMIVYAGMNVPLVVWMMRSFFKEIPYDIIEASKIDGATEWQSFFKISFPVVRSGVVSTTLLCMVFAWNEFFFALSLSYTYAKTVPVYISAFMTQEGLFWAKMSAATTFGITPVLLLGWFAQRQLVRGLTMGAVKG